MPGVFVEGLGKGPCFSSLLFFCFVWDCVLLCRPHWPQTCGYPPASTSQVLGMEIWAPSLGIQKCFYSEIHEPCRGWDKKAVSLTVYFILLEQKVYYFHVIFIELDKMCLQWDMKQNGNGRSLRRLGFFEGCYIGTALAGARCMQNILKCFSSPARGQPYPDAKNLFKSWKITVLWEMMDI